MIFKSGNRLLPLWLMAWLCASRVVGSLGPCCCGEMPNSLDDEFPETTQAGTILFNFTLNMDGVVDLYLETRSNTPEYYLELVVDNITHQHLLVLNHSLSLNDLNPRPSPIPPDSVEDVTCPNVSESNPPPSSGLILALEYTLKCKNSASQELIQRIVVGITEVNDYAPVLLCSPYDKGISELTPIGTTVFILGGLGHDPDVEGGVHGYGYEPDVEDCFDMVGKRSQGFIAVTGELDYDHGQRSYDLNVTVTDKGSPAWTNWSYLRMEILDGDDQNPVFDHNIYDLVLQEQNASLVGRNFKTQPPVYAYDLDFGINATINYTAIAETPFSIGAFFDINSATGEIILLRVLDRETVSQHFVHIQAYQEDKPLTRTASAMVVVTVEDINDHRPEMSVDTYNFTIPEHMSNDAIIGQIFATDKDEGMNAVLDYHLVDGQGIVQIDPETGVLLVEDFTLLDREAQETFYFQVYAQERHTSEQWQSTQSTVVIFLTDINDNNPIHINGGQYDFSVKTSQPAGSPLGWVRANDDDAGRNAEVLYYLVASLSDPGVDLWLSVEAVTGVIRTSQDVVQDNDTVIVVSVEARDQATLPTDRRSSIARVDILFTDDANPTWVPPTAPPSEGTTTDDAEMTTLTPTSGKMATSHKTTETSSATNYESGTSYMTTEPSSGTQDSSPIQTSQRTSTRQTSLGLTSPEETSNQNTPTSPSVTSTHFISKEDCVCPTDQEPTGGLGPVVDDNQSSATYLTVIGVLSSLLLLVLLLLLLLLLCQRRNRVKKEDKSSSTEASVSVDYAFPVDTVSLLTHDQLIMVAGKALPSDHGTDTDPERASDFGNRHDSLSESYGGVEEIQNPVYDTSSNVYVRPYDATVVAKRDVTQNIGDLGLTAVPVCDAIETPLSSSTPREVKENQTNVTTPWQTDFGELAYVPTSRGYVGQNVQATSQGYTSGNVTASNDDDSEHPPLYSTVLPSRDRTQSVYSDCKAEETIEHSVSFETPSYSDHPSLVPSPSGSDCRSLDTEPLYASVTNQDKKSSQPDIFVGVATIFPAMKAGVDEEEETRPVEQGGDKPVETVDSPYSTIQHGSSLRPLASLAPLALPMDVHQPEGEPADNEDDIHIDLSHLMRDRPGRERQSDDINDTDSHSDRVLASSLMMLDSVLAEQDDDHHDAERDTQVKEPGRLSGSTESNALDASRNGTEVKEKDKDSVNKDNTYLDVPRQSTYSTDSSISDLPANDDSIINQTFYTKKGPITML